MSADTGYCVFCLLAEHGNCLLGSCPCPCQEAREARVTIVFGHGTAEARFERPSWRYLSGPDLEAARAALVHELSACTSEQLRRERMAGGQP